MKKKSLVLLAAIALLFVKVIAQTPVVISSQPGYTYTADFADINNWTFNTAPANGTFTSGIGAQAWKGIDVLTTTPSIPNATRITTFSSAFQTPTTSGGLPVYSGGVYKATQALAMLSTGTTDNSSSVAMDFFVDFTGVNAGALSFDWISQNNNTGNRNGSLRVYASTDSINFTEITGAQVLNFTNNAPTSGAITNVSLPSIFNGSAKARLRFYYHNGTGGTSGSRPRISIDNVKVTGLPTVPCTAPIAQPTNFTLGTVLYNSVQFAFTPPSPAAQNYLVVMSTNSSLSSFPLNNTTYNLGDNLGDGTVVAISNTNTVTIGGLTNSTQHYFFIFSMNNVCTGGPLYYSLNPLTGVATTLAGQLPCVSPTVQPTNLILNNITSTSISGSFTTAVNTDEYLVVRTTSPTFTGTLNNGTNYSGGNVLGNGSVITKTAGTNFTSSNLSPGVTYYYFVFGVNSQNCNGGPVYNKINPLTANATTIALPVCNVPALQPTQLNLVASKNMINGSFTPSSSADGYIILRSVNSSLSSIPVNSITYIVGNSIGGGTVIANDANTSFVDINLTSSTQYYYFIFAKNSLCTGGVKYLTTNPLTSTATTTSAPVNNYYFGNLHAHSKYSDGNVDNPSFTPADNYAYAKNSLCMDFLGISEHNHLMNVSNYLPGLNQAAAATTSNFLALYGMEYGVISNGGHVLIYGSNQLIGWDNGNYNLYVPKSNYIGTPESTGITGLFRTINNINNPLGNPAFASFAHPDFADYNNLSSIPYNATADSAVLGCAVASGPAFSTNTTYNDPPSSMAYLDYYNRMLSKGYHIGPFMDHDSHYTNFGRSSNNRLAVISPSLSLNDFYASIKARQFYATEDCDTKVHLTLNNNLMGSIITGSTAPSVSVYAIDPTNPTAIPNIKIMYGIAGSGIAPVLVASTSGYNFSYTDNLLSVGSTGYYYADITIAGNRTITSPIWYTKTSTVPVKLMSFTAILNSNRTVALEWKTSNEINSKIFVVEKSNDGVVFSSIHSVEAVNKDGVNTYNTIDKAPFRGINYYRLKQLDIDGKFTYSNVVAINIDNYETNACSLYPNPVNDVINLQINSTTNTIAKTIITDVSGKVVKFFNINVSKGFQNSSFNINSLEKGNYYLQIHFNNQIIVQKFVKL